MKCENCCYFAYSEGVEYEHCCFHEWGHSDSEVAPCDDTDFDDQPGYDEY